MRSALLASNALDIQTKYMTHMRSVQRTQAVVSLFEIKLTAGKLVTTSFHHMAAICGARKSFSDLILQISNLSELIDYKEEIERA